MLCYTEAENKYITLILSVELKLGMLCCDLSILSPHHQSDFKDYLVFGLPLISLSSLYLISQCVKIHHEVCRAGVAIFHFALVAVSVSLWSDVSISVRLLSVLPLHLHPGVRTVLDLQSGSGFLLSELHQVLVETRHLCRGGLGVVTQPVVRVVDINQICHQLLLGLADISALSLNTK